MSDIPASLNPGPGQTSDTRLIERAIREHWPIPEQYRKPLIDRQITIAINPASSPRESTLAFKAILAANGQNMEQEARDNPKPIQHEHSGAIGLVALRQELLEQDEDYAKVQRRRALESDLHAGPVCENGQPGAMENGKAPGVPRSETNGHCNGSH